MDLNNHSFDCGYVNIFSANEPTCSSHFPNLLPSVRLMIACYQASNLTGIYRLACHRLLETRYPYAKLYVPENCMLELEARIVVRIKRHFKQLEGEK